MKLSLDTIGYGGYFTKNHERLSLEDAVRRAALFGYDAACIFAHRPLGFPMDFDTNRRRRLVDLYQELDLEMGALVCCNNFLEANHILVFNTEKEIMYTKECIDMAVELGSPMVRVMASLWGYFSNPYANDGYGLPAYESRSRRVSRGEDYIEAWHQVRGALTEVAQYAEDKGITLALQTHPEVTNNNDDTLEMLAEVGVDSLKVGVDLPLMEDTTPEGVRETILKMSDVMVYSHTISLATIRTIGGAAYGWEEVTPGSERDPLPWPTFIQACKDVGYDGLLSHEQCSPIVVKGHELGTVSVIDERYVEARNYFQKLLREVDAYTGSKPAYVEYAPEMADQEVVLVA
jgi:sugar phosphate isomerase/epimerase